MIVQKNMEQSQLYKSYPDGFRFKCPAMSYVAIIEFEEEDDEVDRACDLAARHGKWADEKARGIKPLRGIDQRAKFTES